MTRRILLFFLCTGFWLGAEAYALTAQEIVLLKRHGVSETTIQMMLASEIAAHQAAAAGEDTTIRTIQRPGGGKAIVYSTGSQRHEAHQAEERRKEDRAWEMLRQIIVDNRTDQNTE